ncbi:anti-sigma factor family protein [Microvirga sp. M2]|uniref:anti-sigma factor family protein n=1 Tax=Microvirga sp. M2 TaxID=3073270 RepID=UPI0039C00B30
MTAPQDHETDERLVAYLDGELAPDEQSALARRIAADPELQRRLLVLSGGNRPFRQAFETLLAQAPEERLSSMLPAVPAAAPQGRSRSWRAVAAVAAAILLFLAGFATNSLLGPRASLRDLVAGSSRTQDDDDWRQAVAEYLTLYSADTLANIPDDDAMRQREIDSLRARLAINLSARQADIPGLSFKRAQLFEYDGKPLGQLAYLDPATGPVALCMVRSDDEDAPPRTEQREGFNIVFWTQAGHDYMVIGRMPFPRLENLAKDFSDRLAG